MKTFKQFLQEEEIYAKKLGSVSEWTPDLAEGNYRVGKVTFSAKDGLGSVPFNQSVYYHGFVAFMKPSTFHTLALPDDSEQRAKNIVKLVNDSYALGIPFLQVDFKQVEDETGPAMVTGHEGRARMAAVEMLNGDKPVPVHIFLMGGMRARHLTPEMVATVKAKLQAERSKKIVTGPFEDVYVDGKLT
jgi:hypothetical protein